MWLYSSHQAISSSRKKKLTTTAQYQQPIIFLHIHTLPYRPSYYHISDLHAIIIYSYILAFKYLKAKTSKDRLSLFVLFEGK